MSKKVIIIGGGICGLTTAISLSRSGFEVVVFERSGELREIGAGITLWSNGIYALKKMGLDEPVRALGQVATRFELLGQNGRSLGLVDTESSVKKLGVPHISINRKRLMNALESCIDNRNMIHLDHDFVSYGLSKDGVEAQFACGHVEFGDILLACDGFNSKVRQAVLKNDEKRYAGYTCWRGVTKAPDWYTARGAVSHYVGPGAQVGIFDVGDDTVCWYATSNEEAGIKESPEQRKAHVLNRFSDWNEFVRKTFEATEANDYLKNDIYDREPTKKWTDDRVLLMGDAAHPTTPNLGQGACQALEDASVITDCLLYTEDYRHAFARYSRLRQKRTTEIVMSSRRSGDISQLESKLLTPVRDIVMEAMVRTGRMKEFEQAVCYKV